MKFVGANRNLHSLCIGSAGGRPSIDVGATCPWVDALNALTSANHGWLTNGIWPAFDAARRPWKVRHPANRRPGGRADREFPGRGWFGAAAHASHFFLAARFA